MDVFWDSVLQVLERVRTLHETYRWIQAVTVLVVGIPLVWLLSRYVRRLTSKRFSQQTTQVLGKGIWYGGLLLVFVQVLLELEYELTPLLGAAGIVGIAIGFASQTSLGNVISGIFLISEKPFVIGNIIKLGETVGIVEEINLLSINIRTFDNRMVRVPNETVIKADIVNITRFPIRRLDFNIGVAYKTDVQHVRDVLLDIARRNPLVLDEPEPIIIFKDFGDSALEFLFGCWFVKTDYIQVKNAVMDEIKRRFDEEDIEIPFPHRTIYTGEVTKPWPVSLTRDEQEPDDHTS